MAHSLCISVRDSCYLWLTMSQAFWVSVWNSLYLSEKMLHLLLLLYEIGFRVDLIASMQLTTCWPKKKTTCCFFFGQTNIHYFRRVYTPTRGMVTTKEKANSATTSTSPLLAVMSRFCYRFWCDKSWFFLLTVWEITACYIQNVSFVPYSPFFR